MAKRYPAMKTRRVRLVDFSDLQIDATVDLDGRPVVAIHFDDGHSDDVHLSPAEAERLSAALFRAAEAVRAKRAWCVERGIRVAPENQTQTED